ncbi:MAG: hypothetical protein IJX28_01265 [Clostridia bacterium]|nr:hypothetical protein [Clostridia bacterium]
MNTFKNDRDITQALAEKKERGGAIFLPVGEYPVESSILMDTPSLRVQGEVWAYNLDPNGVFETRFGSKLRLVGKDHAAFSIGKNDLPAGSMIADIGIQGDIIGMDTRGMFDPAKPWASAGLYFGGERVDQGEFYKISNCGLAAGVSCAENTEIDACDFRKINVDGCDVGFYFAPRASYYTRFHRCIVGDTPSFGFYATSPDEKTRIHNLEIVDTHFVRNSGANHIQGVEPAAVFLNQVSTTTFMNNKIDDAGTFWYYEPDAKSNSDKTVYKTPAIGLHMIAKRSQIMNNVIQRSSRESIVLCGTENAVVGNVVDGDVVIEGEGNIVNCLTFTKPEARLILKGAAATTTVVLGVEEHRILRIPD